MMLHVGSGFSLGVALVWFVRAWQSSGLDVDIALAVTALLLAVCAVLIHLKDRK